MISQYSWASVKQQQRRFIEYGAMITLSIMILSFSIKPRYESAIPETPVFEPPPLDVYEVPPTRQDAPSPPPIAPEVTSSTEASPEMDADLNWEMPSGPVDGIVLSKPAPPDIEVPFYAVQSMPEPIGGYNAILSKVVYPEMAREVGIEGKVLIEALIGSDGVPREIVVLSGVSGTGLDEEAMKAVAATRFHPALQRDKPVAVRMTIPIVFRLH